MLFFFPLLSSPLYLDNTICNWRPGAVTSKDEAGTSVSSSWISWDYLDGGIVLDATKGMVYQLRLDPGIILDDFLSRPPHELPTVLKLLLRRTGCRDHIVQLLRKGLVSKTNSAEMAQGFQVLNSAYRQVIEALSQKSGTRQTTVSLQELEAQIAYQSVLSEKDMVTLVFHPHFVTSEGLEEVIPEDLGNDSFALEHWSIPHDLRQAPEKGQVNQGGKTPYVLSVVILYLRSLLGLQILPHKILQCFVFDLCVYFRPGPWCDGLNKAGPVFDKKNRMPLCHVFFLLQYEQFIYIYIEFLRFFWQLRNMMKHDRMSLYSFDFESYTHVRGWRRNSLLLEPNSGLVTGKSISCSSCYTIMFSSQFTVI